jgi:hypothetical protein
MITNGVMKEAWQARELVTACKSLSVERRIFMNLD